MWAISSGLAAIFAMPPTICITSNEVRVSTNGTRLLRALEQRLSGGIELGPTGLEHARIAVDVAEELLSERLLGRHVADEAAQPAHQRLPGRKVGQVRR